MGRSLNIAFHAMGGDLWSVGQVYLKNLLHALSIQQKEIKSYLLTPAEFQNGENYAISVNADSCVSYENPSKWTMPWLFDRFTKRMLSRNVLMERVLKKHLINVLFDYTIPYRYPQIATLSWLPDFQHIHLPEMFSSEERSFRDRMYIHSTGLATRVILMSEAVKKDFTQFAPTYAHKARVLHPISSIHPSVYEFELNSILNLYNIPEKFFYLPNQFWKHKNHETVFQAVRVLKEKGTKVFVICTGNSTDYRDATHFPKLFSKLSQFGIRDQIAYLGLVPHDHVFLLMRQSICVVNPSLFEGWGYTVDEARSLGKQALLSDIPTHREQNPPKALFFNPRDPDELAEKMALIWSSTKPGPDIELEINARQLISNRLKAYGESFISIASEAVEEIN